MTEQDRAAERAAITAVADALARRGLEENLQEEAALLYTADAGLAYVALCTVAGTCTEAQLDAKLESVLLP